MKKILSIIFIGMAVQSYAQMPNNSPLPPQTQKHHKNKQNKAPKSLDEKLAKRMAKLTKELNLTPSQQAQLSPILRDKMIKNQGEKIKNAEKKQENQAFRQQVKDILSPEQQALLATKAKHRKNHKNKNRNR